MPHPFPLRLPCADARWRRPSSRTAFALPTGARRARRVRTPIAAVLLAVLVCGPAGADDFVDVLGRVWVKKGGLACDKASAAAANTTGPFSGCVRLPVALRVAIVDTAEPPAQVYYMRVAGDDGIPKFAWFARQSLTNNPRPSDFRPDP